MTAVEFLERMGRSSEATEYTYGKALVKLANCFDVQSADVVADQIKAHKLHAYKALDKFVAYLIGQGLAPKTVITYELFVKARTMPKTGNRVGAGEGI